MRSPLGYLLRPAVATAASAARSTTTTATPATGTAASALTVTALASSATAHRNGNAVGTVEVHFRTLFFCPIEVVTAFDGDGAGIR